MSERRPRLTEKAKELLEEYGTRIRNMIHNIAEKRALDRESGEVNDDDIYQAQKSVPISLPTTKRKWCIRVLIFLTFSFLIAQIGAFYQLFSYVETTGLPLIVQLGLILPTFIVLLFMVVFSWLFKDDWFSS